jgi:hypothetical protein
MRQLASSMKSCGPGTECQRTRSRAGEQGLTEGRAVGPMSRLQWNYAQTPLFPPVRGETAQPVRLGRR